MSPAILSTSIIPVRDFQRQASRIFVRIAPKVRTLDEPLIASGSLRAAIQEAGREYGFDLSDGLTNLPSDNGGLLHTYQAPLLIFEGKPYDLRITVA